MKIKIRNRNDLIFFVICIVTLILAFSNICVFTVKGSNTTNMNSYELKVKEATDEFYVNDFANVFTKEQKEELMSEAIKMNEEYLGVQVVVTTVETLDGIVIGFENETDSKKISIEEVAYSMFNQYGIGEDNMGVLVLFSTGDRKVRIETGKQMQVYITDSISGQILDNYGMEYFINDNFAEGLISVQEGLINEIQKRVPSDWKKENMMTSVQTTSVETNKDTFSSSSGKILLRFLGLIFVIIGLVLKIVSLVLKNKNIKQELDVYKNEKEKDLKYQKETFELKLLEAENKNKAKIKTNQLIIEKLRKEVLEKQQKIKSLNKILEVEKDKFARIQKLHPEFNFENEISEMIESEYKKSAYEVDEKLSKILKVDADKDNIGIFGQAISLYDKSRPEVKKYIVSDIKKIHDLYDNSVFLKEEFERIEQEKKDKAVANEVYFEIKSIFIKYSRWDHTNYEILNAAYFKFTSLTTSQKKFFPNNDLILKLEKELIVAERDYKDFKTAREAKREISSIVDNIYSADENDRNNLERAMRCYKSLSVSQQAYFPDDLLQNLKRKTSDAEADHKRKERIRNQKRIQSSSIGRSSFSGRGGRSSGGGASRGF